MTERAFADANVFIYASGPADPHSRGAARVIDEIARAPGQVWSSAEVLQEILHVHIRRHDRDRARRTLQLVNVLLPNHIAPLLPSDVSRALSLHADAANLQARDLIHLAVMQRLGISHIISADHGFDNVSPITRLDPRNFDAWRDTIFGA